MSYISQIGRQQLDHLNLDPDSMVPNQGIFGPAVVRRDQVGGGGHAGGTN